MEILSDVSEKINRDGMDRTFECFEWCGPF